MMYILKDKQHETLGTIHETTIDGKQWYSESDVAKLLQIPDWFNVLINNSDYLQKARKYGHFTGYKN